MFMPEESLSEVTTERGESTPPLEVMKQIHLTMVKIRRFEERAVELFMAQEIPGFLHSYIGQEAIAAGACACLTENDYITSTHRGHGHVIAKGLALDRMMAELFGRTTGYCKGKGGSMHIVDFSKGVLGANGVVAGSVPIATGAALSIRIRRSGQVIICFFGDGGANQGSFFEAANMAAVWDLPIVYICENNQWALSTPQSYHMKIKDISLRAVALGFPGITVDGNDAIAIYQTVAGAVARARRGEGPTLVESKTYRILGHYTGDPASYQPKEEVAAWKAKDPIARFEKYLAERGVLSKEEMESAHQSVKQEVEAAVEFARRSPRPRPEEALDDVGE